MVVNLCPECHRTPGHSAGCSRDVRVATPLEQSAIDLRCLLTDALVQLDQVEHRVEAQAATHAKVVAGLRAELATTNESFANVMQGAVDGAGDSRRIIDDLSRDNKALREALTHLAKERDAIELQVRTLTAERDAAEHACASIREHKDFVVAENVTLRADLAKAQFAKGGMDCDQETIDRLRVEREMLHRVVAQRDALELQLARSPEIQAAADRMFAVTAGLVSRVAPILARFVSEPISWSTIDPVRELAYELNPQLREKA